MSQEAATTEQLRKAGFARRLYAYSKERFPLFNHGLLIVSFYSSNQFLALALESPGQPMRYGQYTIPGAITLFCIFLHLRVFDEHKDFEEDARHHPERLLQKGIITLAELRLLGLLAITLEVLLASIRGLPTFYSLLAVIVFSLLMLKEFFIRDWLRDHFLVYALSHMLIMPLLALLVFSFATGKPFWAASGWFVLYAMVGFFVTLNWEISRKIRAPGDEIDGLDSYTKVFGTYGAAYLVLLVRAIDTALVALVGWHLGLSLWFYGVLLLLYAVCLLGFLQFRFATSTQTAKRMEAYAGFYIVAFDITLAAALVTKYGLIVGGP